LFHPVCVVNKKPSVFEHINEWFAQKQVPDVM